MLSSWTSQEVAHHVNVAEMEPADPARTGLSLLIYYHINMMTNLRALQILHHTIPMVKDKEPCRRALSPPLPKQRQRLKHSHCQWNRRQLLCLQGQPLPRREPPKPRVRRRQQPMAQSLRKGPTHGTRCSKQAVSRMNRLRSRRAGLLCHLCQRLPVLILMMTQAFSDLQVVTGCHRLSLPLVIVLGSGSNLS